MAATIVHPSLPACPIPSDVQSHVHSRPRVATVRILYYGLFKLFVRWRPCPPPAGDNLAPSAVQAPRHDDSKATSDGESDHFKTLDMYIPASLRTVVRATGRLPRPDQSVNPCHALWSYLHRRRQRCPQRGGHCGLLPAVPRISGHYVPCRAGLCRDQVTDPRRGLWMPD